MEVASAENDEVLQGSGTACLQQPSSLLLLFQGSTESSYRQWKGVCTNSALDRQPYTGKEWLADTQVLESRKALEQTAPIL